MKTSLLLFTSVFLSVVSVSAEQDADTCSMQDGRHFIYMQPLEFTAFTLQFDYGYLIHERIEGVVVSGLRFTADEVKVKAGGKLRYYLKSFPGNLFFNVQYDAAPVVIHYSNTIGYEDAEEMDFMVYRDAVALGVGRTYKEHGFIYLKPSVNFCIWERFRMPAKSVQIQLQDDFNEDYERIIKHRNRILFILEIQAGFRF